MGKHAAQWLMSNLEHLVVGVNPKSFFSLREGDTAFTLQRSSNSSGQFLLLTELKAGGSRRTVFLPEGKERNGWRAFGLELRKVLNPSLYAVDGSDLPKFIPQRRNNLELHHLGTYAEVVQGAHGRREVRRKPNQQKVLVQVKKPLQGEEKMGMNPRIPGEVGGDYLVDKHGSMVAMGGDRREICYSDVVVAGEHPLADSRTSLPRLRLNSNNVGKEKKCDAGSYDWSGRGLIVEVDVTGRRRVFWESRKGGVPIGSDSREVAW